MSEGHIALIAIAALTLAYVVAVILTIRYLIRARRNNRTNDRINRLD
jgi:hypothetical protein